MGDNFEVDTVKVFEVLNKIVSLIKVQMMRDRYTTPACSFETLNRMIMLKLEDDQTMESYIAELVLLLRKPRDDGLPIVQMIPASF